MASTVFSFAPAPKGRQPDDDDLSEDRTASESEDLHTAGKFLIGTERYLRRLWGKDRQRSGESASKVPVRSRKAQH